MKKDKKEEKKELKGLDLLDFYSDESRPVAPKLNLEVGSPFDMGPAAPYGKKEEKKEEKKENEEDK